MCVKISNLYIRPSSVNAAPVTSRWKRRLVITIEIYISSDSDLQRLHHLLRILLREHSLTKTICACMLMCVQARIFLCALFVSASDQLHCYLESSSGAMFVTLQNVWQNTNTLKCHLTPIFLRADVSCLVFL